MWHETRIVERGNPHCQEMTMLKFLASAAGIIFIIGLLVVIGLLALIF